MRATLAPPVSATAVVYEDGYFHLTLEGGSSYRFRADITPRLRAATPAQRALVEILPCSLHWPLIDEDLDLEALLEQLSET
jgi:hypothetical protein